MSLRLLQASLSSALVYNSLLGSFCGLLLRFPVPQWRGSSRQRQGTAPPCAMLDQAGVGMQLLLQETAEGCQAELICQDLSLCF